ncbi:MAG: hypothetical protein HDR02_16810 [Lachnospiraceae bacterium]|nr:hypothetical protein [Lachnospiraceae bacterium]
MPVMDEFREEREAIKQKSLKERFQYFLDYYKWHVIGGVVLIACAISLVHSVATRKEWAFYGAFVNAYQTPQYDAFREDFADRADIDLKEYDVLFDTNMYITDNAFDQGNVDATERLAVYIAAGDVDVMASGPLVINRYAYNGMFWDLRQVLPQELQEQLEPYYYYMDAALAAEFEAAQEGGALETTPSYPTDPSRAEDMREPVPVGLYIQDCPRIQEAFIFQEEDVILSVVGNVAETDSILQLIRMIYDIEN